MTPKPVLGPITGYQNYVSQNYPPGVSSDVAMRELADKWRLLTKEEKKSYDVPEHEVNRIKTIQKIGKKQGKRSILNWLNLKKSISLLSDGRAAGKSITIILYKNLSITIIKFSNL